MRGGGIPPLASCLAGRRGGGGTPRTDPPALYIGTPSPLLRGFGGWVGCGLVCGMRFAVSIARFPGLLGGGGWGYGLEGCFGGISGVGVVV